MSYNCQLTKKNTSRIAHAIVLFVLYFFSSMPTAFANDDDDDDDDVKIEIVGHIMESATPIKDATIRFSQLQWHQNQPDRRITYFFRAAKENTSDYFHGLANENSPETSSTGRIYSFLNEDIVLWLAANVKKNIAWLGQTRSLQFGTMNYYRNRHIEVDALGYVSLNPFGITIIGTSTNNLYQHQHFLACQHRPIQDSSCQHCSFSTNYHGISLLRESYSILNHQFSLKIKLTQGHARIEHYKQMLEATGYGKRGHDNTGALPSALNNKTNLRLAAGLPSVNAPALRKLAAYHRPYDFNNKILKIDNPERKRSKAVRAAAIVNPLCSSVCSSLRSKLNNVNLKQVNEI